VRHGKAPHLMSALPLKVDIAGRRLDVRFVPIADISRTLGNVRFVPNSDNKSLFDSLVGAQ
jgi:hypothetical protein